MADAPNRAARATAAALLLALAGCNATPRVPDLASPPPTALRPRTFLLTSPAEIQGTATLVADGVLMSCRHVLPDGIDFVRIDGHRMAIRQLAGGSGEDVATDWVAFAAERAGPALRMPSHVRVDFEHPLQPGDEVYVIGFGGDRNPVREHDAGIRHLVRGIVTAPPSGWDAPEHAICLQLANRDDYHGLSGGPVIHHDAERDEAIIVGLIYGKVTYIASLGVWRTSIHQAVRPPVVIGAGTTDLRATSAAAGQSD